MYRKPYRIQMIILSSALLVCLLNCRRIFANTEIRSVDILSLIALGMVIGSIITRTAGYIRARNRGSDLM